MLYSVSSRQHLNHDVCLEKKNRRLAELSRIQLYSKCVHLYEQFLQVIKDWVLSHWDHSTVIGCVCMHYFLLHFILHIFCCIIVTWWCGPDGIEVWSGRPSSSFSAITLLVGSFVFVFMWLIIIIIIIRFVKRQNVKRLPWR